MSGSPGFRYFDNFQSLLSGTKVEEIAPKRGLIILEDSSRVEDALRALAASNLTSAPVRNSIGACVGFVDMIDFVAYLWKVISFHIDSHGSTMRELVVKSDLFASQALGNIVDASGRNPYVSVPLGSSISDAVIALCTLTGPVFATHRVAIVDADTSNIVSILSQRAIVSYLARNVTTLGEHGQQAISTFADKFRPVVSVKVHEQSIQAFSKIQANQVEAVAVIGDSNKLVACLSATDLKGIDSTNFHQLFLSVPEFIKARYAQFGKVMTPPAIAMEHTTLETVVLKLAAADVHRVFIVNDAGYPVSVFSMSDLLVLIGSLPTPAPLAALEAVPPDTEGRGMDLDTLTFPTIHWG